MICPDTHVGTCHEWLCAELTCGSVDSLTGLRVASWAHKVLDVHLRPEDFFDGQVVTLADAVRLVASRL